MSFPMGPSEFIRHKYGIDFKGNLPVWDRMSRRTKYFSASDLPGLDDYITTLAAVADVYVALGLQAEKLEPHKRGSTDTVIALPGFVADIDFANAKDSTKRYPEDEADALEILSTFAFPPTAVVRTGNGLHAHWHLTELFKCDTEEGRAQAKLIWIGFQRLLSSHFLKYHREIDSVGDLTRNYRLPGTFNRKASPPKPVDLIEFNPERRYDITDIETAIGGLRPTLPAKIKSAPQEPTGDHEAILDGCSWYRDVVVNGAATCSEPDWYAGASITALCTDGERIFHEYSSRHPDYERSEASKKLQHAVDDAGPRTCQSIAADLGHPGCRSCRYKGRISSPIQIASGRRQYDPGHSGPLAIGYTKEGLYALLDRQRSIIVYASANQLLSMQSLLGLAPSSFWRDRFPHPKASFDQMGAGEALIAACKCAGAFLPTKVRGRGIWLEGDKIIPNLGGQVPENASYRYLCFEPIRLEGTVGFKPQRLLTLLQAFNWRNPKDAMLLFGWLAIAPICGVLNWRPHIFVYGPPRCGKTTIHVLGRLLLTPLVVSTEGSSSEAGIRQTLGPDSLPVAVDEFENDHATGQLRAVIRLARSASSAENPVLRGTPEGRAMQFSLRTTFFFCAVNPVGLSPADESRIVLLELLMHDNDETVATKIRQEEIFFRDQGPGWCSYMVALAPEIPPAIEELERVFPSSDRRHRQNMATLVAGSFVALNGRRPTADEAQALAKEFAGTVEVHAEALDRDDAQECLDHLLSFVVERYTLGHWLGYVHEQDDSDEFHLGDARRLVQMHGMVLKPDGNEPGLFIRNGAPAIDKIFQNTRWAERGWMRALRKLEGSFTPRNPIYFGHLGSRGVKARALGLPLDYIPAPFARLDDGARRAARDEKNF